MTNTLFIKNMVCSRCIAAVEHVFLDLEIPIITIQLGQVSIEAALNESQKTALSQRLQVLDFQLLDDRQTQIINNIKSILIQEIHYQEKPVAVNFSVLLAEKLHYDYAHLSRLFSKIEGRTIEQFIIAQKIERIKELLTYGELTLKEIAFQMHYSSAAHLSSQFKKVTGMPPTAFKKMIHQKRQPLDEV